VVFEYEFGQDGLSLARVELNGNYPDEGWSMNKECDQIFYCQNGAGEIKIKSDSYSFNSQDAIFIGKGKKYQLKGKADLLVINSPAWHPGQYRIK
jgi:mannose-6-phosphate isomerase-like protein (cupin superfamily)